MTQQATATKPTCEVCAKKIPHWRARNGQTVCSTQCWVVVENREEAEGDRYQFQVAAADPVSPALDFQIISDGKRTEPVAEPVSSADELPAEAEPKRYLPWSEAGGHDECAHGYADGIPCPRCDDDVRDKLRTHCAVAIEAAKPDEPPPAPYEGPTCPTGDDDAPDIERINATLAWLVDGEKFFDADTLASLRRAAVARVNAELGRWFR